MSVRRMRLVPLTAAAVVLLGACGPLSSTATRSGRPNVAAVSHDPSGAPGGGPSAGAGPLARLLPYPAGSTPWTKDTGQMGLNRFVDEMFVKSAWKREHGLMTERGFVRAARRGWINADGSQDDVWLVDFASASGARSMYLGLGDSWPEGGKGDRTFTDAAVHGKGEVAPALDDLGNAYAKVIAVRGSTVVYAKVFTAAHPDEAAAKSLVARQYARLGG